MEGGWFDNLLLDIDRADAIVKMLVQVCGLGGWARLLTRVLAEGEAVNQRQKAKTLR